MRRCVVDASALAAIVFQEDGFERVSDLLKNAALYAPELLKFELANTAWKKIARAPADAPRLLTNFSIALEGRFKIIWHDVRSTDVVLIARTTGLSTYDASYLWLAGYLGADLVTLDKKLADALNM